MADDQFDFPDEEDNDYEELIRYYFYKGFTCKEIRQFLSELAPTERQPAKEAISEYHNRQMSLSNLKRCIKQLGLRRRNAEGQDSSRGYRSISHTLQMNGI